MYGLPTNFDVSIFLMKKLELICFSENTLTFSFEENLSITLMGTFVYKQSPHSTATKESLPLSSSNLMGIIGKKICNVEGNKEGSLTLQFENGHILVFLDDSQDYESYIIHIDDRDIVV